MALIVFLTFLLVHQSLSLLPPSRKAVPGEAPFMVRITDQRKFCGGALIRPNIILTAGHCADGRNPGEVTVRAGTNYVYYPDKGQERTAEKLVPHEHFRVGDNGVQAYNDIGLIKLSKAFVMDSQIQVIDWANISLDLTPTLFGFGYTDDVNKEPAEYLRTINVTFIPEDECVDLLKTTKTKSVKESYEVCSQVCACNGDSGSPLTQVFDGVRKVVGVASWLADDLYTCTQPPAIFLKVAEYEDWINDKLKELEMDNVIEGGEPKEVRYYHSHRYLFKKYDNEH